MPALRSFEVVNSNVIDRLIFIAGVKFDGIFRCFFFKFFFITIANFEPAAADVESLTHVE